MAGADYTAAAGHCFAQLPLRLTRTCTKCRQEHPATKDFFHASKRSPDGLRSVCKRCHAQHYGRPSVVRRANAYRADRGVLFGKHRALQVCWLEVTCRACGVAKRYTEFAIDSARGKRKATCKPCRNRSRLPLSEEEKSEAWERNKARLVALRETEAGRETIRQAKRRARQRLIARGLTTNGTRRKVPLALKLAAEAQKQIAAARAWRRRWSTTDAPAPCVAAWYAATDKPWNNPRLSQADRWRTRYALDDGFRAKEVIKAQLRKQSRRERVEAQSDGTVTRGSLGALFAAATCCTYCGAGLTSTQKTADHVVPLHSGGLHSIDNLVIACFDCNTRKGRKTLKRWLTENPPTSSWARSISSRLQRYWASRPEACVTGPMLREMATELTTGRCLSGGTSRANAA